MYKVTILWDDGDFEEKILPRLEAKHILRCLGAVMNSDQGSFEEPRLFVEWELIEE